MSTSCTGKLLLLFSALFRFQTDVTCNKYETSAKFNSIIAQWRAAIAQSWSVHLPTGRLGVRFTGNCRSVPWARAFAPARSKFQASAFRQMPSLKSYLIPYKKTQESYAATSCYKLLIYLFLCCYRTYMVASPRQIDCFLGLRCLAISFVCWLRTGSVTLAACRLCIILLYVHLQLR